MVTITGSPELRAAYALYERRPQIDAPPASHIEFLIDRSGDIRARWRPGYQMAEVDELIARIEAHYYRAIEFDSMDDFALGPRVKQAVLANYVVDHDGGNGTFLIPR